jgi:ADP-ribosylglycohydrolase/protein-tyrosine phosphatase
MNRLPAVKDSASSPLRIAELPLGEDGGCLGLTLCPGKKDFSRGWNRDLETDLRAVSNWGASTVVTLIEAHEFELLKVSRLGESVEQTGMRWIHLPIRDVDVPDHRFEEGWRSAGPEIHRRLRNREKILIHCRGGIGRTGLVAGLILVEHGCAPREAIQKVRAVRPGAIETAAQERYVLSAKMRPAEGTVEHAETDHPAGFTRHIPPAPMRERYQGCLLGGAIGDALGAPVEFLSRAEILRKFGPRGLREMVPAYGRLGAITDDTQMTLFTAEGALRAYVRGTLRGICHPPSVIHYAYLRWLHTQAESLPKDNEYILTGWLIQRKELFSRRAPGTTCISSLHRLSEIGKPARNDSKGCGGVMRVAPIGMMFHSLSTSNPNVKAMHFQQAFDLACDAAALTHGHPTGYLAAGVMAALVFELLGGAGLSSAIDRTINLLKARQDHEETLLALERARDLSRSNTSPYDAIRQLGEGWVADEALAIGVYCSLRAAELEKGIVMAVNHDGDSDSTGLIAGHLLGAMRGLSAIPARWLAALELRNVIEEMADDLATAKDWILDSGGDPATSVEAGYYQERYPGC